MSPSTRALMAVVVVVVSTVGLVGPAAGVGVTPPADHLASQPGADDRLAQGVDADSVRMLIALQPDGDARWTVTYRVRLESDNETAAWESLREDVQANPDNYTGRFASRMRSTAATAENATGREMTVRNVSVDARTQSVPSYGILEYTFEWTNFATVDGDAIRAGDAIAGLFLDEQTTLVVAWPAGYGLETAAPQPDDDVGGERSVGWAGPEDFASGEPSVVVREGASGPGEGGLPMTALLGGGALLVVALAGGAMWFLRREGDEPARSETDGVAAEPDAARTADGSADEGPPEELLSNEEKVLKLVRERGGRIKQQEIVKAFDWTEAKTSQVVRDLREEGDLEGFRLGRENVLRLPEEGDDRGR